MYIHQGAIVFVYFPPLISPSSIVPGTSNLSCQDWKHTPPGNCLHRPRSFMARSGKTRVHSVDASYGPSFPASERINGVAITSPDFTKIFECAVGSPLNLFKK